MDIQRKCFEESNNVNPDWSFKFDEELQQYVAIDFEMTNQVDEFNEHWDTFRAGWQAKSQAVPEVSTSIAAHQRIIDEIKTEIDEGYDLCQDSYLLDVLVEKGIEIGKIKAVPEGFVLMPIKPTETMVMAVVKEHEGDAFLPYSLYDAYVKQAMIEAQEPSQ